MDGHDLVPTAQRPYPIPAINARVADALASLPPPSSAVARRVKLLCSSVRLCPLPIDTPEAAAFVRYAGDATLPLLQQAIRIACSSTDASANAAQVAPQHTERSDMCFSPERKRARRAYIVRDFDSSDRSASSASSRSDDERVESTSGRNSNERSRRSDRAGFPANPERSDSSAKRGSASARRDLFGTSATAVTTSFFTAPPDTERIGILQGEQTVPPSRANDTQGSQRGSPRVPRSSDAARCAAGNGSALPIPRSADSLSATARPGPSSSRPYRPEFRSSGFAILIALLRADAPMGKRELLRAAAPLSRAPLEAQPRARDAGPFPTASGWSVVSRTLEPRGLVSRTRHGRFDVFALTVEGRALAQELSDQLQAWESRQRSPRPAHATAWNAYQLILLVDHRERVRGRESFATDVAAHGIDVREMHLDVGDICWGVCEVGSRDPIALAPLLIERKTANDLFSTIIDKSGRFHRQRHQMRTAGLPCAYIIEGDIDGTINGRSDFGARRTALCELECHEGFQVFHVPHADATAQLLLQLTSALWKQITVKDPRSWFGTAPTLESIRERVQKARSFTTKALHAAMLQQIRRSSADAAAAIVDEFPTPVDLRDALLGAHDRDVALHGGSLAVQRASGRALGQELARTIAKFYAG